MAGGGDAATLALDAGMRPGDARRGPIRRIDAFVDRRIAAVGETSWGFTAVVGRAASAGGVGVVGVHLVQWRTVDRSDGAAGWSAALAVVVVAVLALVVLARIYWRTRLDTESLGPYFVAALWSIVALGFVIEAFAGLTTLLAAEGIIDSVAGAPPSLWAVVHHYTWHTVNAIPLLDVPGTLDWQQPELFDDTWSGVLLLALQLVLVAPVVRLAYGAYQVSEQRSFNLRVREREKVRRGAAARAILARVDDLSPRTSAGVATALAVMTGVACVALKMVSDQGSGLNRWIDRKADAGFTVAGEHLSPGWATAVTPIVAAIVVILLLGFAALVLLVVFDDLSSIAKVSTAAGTVVSYVVFVSFTVVAGAAVAMAFVRVGWIDTNASDGVARAGDVVEAVAWQVIDSLPGPEIAETLQWTPDLELRGRVGGGVILLTKVALLVVLVFPVARVLRSYRHNVQPKRPVASPIEIAAGFHATLRRALDATAVYADDVDRARAAGERYPSFSQTDAQGRALHARAELDRGLDAMHTVFGTTPVALAADAAAGALSRWYEDIGNGRRSGSEPAATTDVWVADVEAAVDGYRETLIAVLDEQLGALSEHPVAVATTT